MTKNRLIFNIILKTIIGVAVTAAILIVIISKSILYAVLFAIAGLIITVFYAKTHLLFVINKKTEGVITHISIEVYTNRVRPSGNKMYSPIISESYPAYNSYDEKVIILTVKKKNGKSVEKTYPFNKNTAMLKIGDAIEYSYFDSCPTVILK